MWKIKQVFSSIPGQVLDFIVVLVGLVVIFKEKITDIVNSIFTKITNQTKKI